MIEIEWKPNIRRERVMILLPPMPSPAVCQQILSQPLIRAHYRNTIHTICKNERVPYVIVYVAGFQMDSFEDIERFERLYDIELRIIPELELLYTSLEYSATLTHECVYMVRQPANWKGSRIPLEWFLDVVLQEQVYPYYDDVGYWLAKELRKFIKLQSGSSVIYEKCMLSLKFMSALETLLKKTLALLDKKTPPAASGDDPDGDAEGSFMELLIDPAKINTGGKCDADADANAEEDEAAEDTEADANAEDAEAEEDAEAAEDDEIDDWLPQTQQKWVIVLGEMTIAEKEAVYATLKPLLDNQQVHQLICIGFHQEKNTRMNCDEWFYDQEGLRLYPTVQYQSYRSMHLTTAFLKDMLPKLNFATAQRLVPTSLFWIGSFRLEEPDIKRRWPKAFYTPAAWCSLHPNETYGASHAATDWLLYEPAGALHLMSKPSSV